MKDNNLFARKLAQDLKIFNSEITFKFQVCRLMTKPISERNVSGENQIIKLGKGKVCERKP